MKSWLKHKTWWRWRKVDNLVNNDGDDIQTLDNFSNKIDNNNLLLLISPSLESNQQKYYSTKINKKGFSISNLFYINLILHFLSLCFSNPHWFVTLFLDKLRWILGLSVLSILQTFRPLGTREMLNVKKSQFFFIAPSSDGTIQSSAG